MNTKTPFIAALAACVALFALCLFHAPVARAQATNLNFTNTVSFTQRWSNVTASISTRPTDTNGVWVVGFSLNQVTNPAFRGTSNSITIGYSASASASVTISNATIASYSGLTVSQFLERSYYTISTQVIDAAKKVLNDEFSRR